MSNQKKGGSDPAPLEIDFGVINLDEIETRVEDTEKAAKPSDQQQNTNLTKTTETLGFATAVAKNMHENQVTQFASAELSITHSMISPAESAPPAKPAFDATSFGLTQIVQESKEKRDNKWNKALENDSAKLPTVELEARHFAVQQTETPQVALASTTAKPGAAEMVSALEPPSPSATPFEIELSFLKPMPQAPQAPQEPQIQQGSIEIESHPKIQLTPQIQMPPDLQVSTQIQIPPQLEISPQGSGQTSPQISIPIVQQPRVHIPPISQSPTSSESLRLDLSQTGTTIRPPVQLEGTSVAATDHTISAHQSSNPDVTENALTNAKDNSKDKQKDERKSPQSETTSTTEQTEQTEQSEQTIATVPPRKKKRKGDVLGEVPPMTERMDLSETKNNKTKLGIAIALFASSVAVAGYMFMPKIMEIIHPTTNDNIATSSTGQTTQQTRLAAKPLPPKNTSGSISQQNTPGKAPAEQLESSDILQNLSLSLPRDLSSSKNSHYFRELERSIIAGDPYGAIQHFRAKIDGPFDATDKIIATELEARYYLLTGSPKKAADVLQPICSSDNGANALTCLHYARALVSAQRWKDAKAFLDRAFNLPEYDGYKPYIYLSFLALHAMSTPRSDTLRDLLNNLVSEMNLNPEWHRQRSQWLAISLMNTSRSERYRTLKYFFESRRESMNTAFKHDDAIGMTSVDPLLVPFINSQVSLLELRPLGLSSKRNRWETDFSRAAVLLGLIDLATTESAGAISTIAQSFVGKPTFGELGKIVAANIQLNEGNTQDAWNLYSQEVTNIRTKKSKFAFDWILVAARCVAAAGNPDSANNALHAIQSQIAQHPSLKNDFHLWLTIAKLERVRHKYELKSVERAQELAVTAQDMGLAAAEMARKRHDLNQPTEAAKVVLEATRKIPHHGILLQTATEILPRAGLDPKKTLEAQSKIPLRFMNRNLEYPIMSDLAISTLVREL